MRVDHAAKKVPTYPVTGEWLHDSAGWPAVELWQGVGSLQDGGAQLALHHGAAAVAGGVQHDPAADPDLLQAGVPLSRLPHRGSRGLMTEDSFRPEADRLVKY